MALGRPLAAPRAAVVANADDVSARSEASVTDPLVAAFGDNNAADAPPQVNLFRDTSKIV
jgi:hypothetical protein